MPVLGGDGLVVTLTQHEEIDEFLHDLLERGLVLNGLLELL